ncbi:MAG: cardiolipin synthase [Verrucomicrobia bacterium]|nr:cardiolipin synthase [Verrucomicrobiota bacterium]
MHNRKSKKPRLKTKKIKGWVVMVITAHVMGFLTSISAVMEARTPQGSVAWLISLNTIPYVSVPAYWFLGRSHFNGYVTARQLAHEEMADRFNALHQELAPFAEDESKTRGADRVAQQLADLPLLSGNDVKLLVDGEATFASILQGMNEAKEYILFQFYIVHDDEIGRAAKDILIDKARQGLHVYFLYDEIGSHDLPKSYKQELSNAGVEVYAFNTQKGPRNHFQINFRNHRKIVVVDGKTAWIGGHNVGDEYLGKDPTFGHWRDTHLRIEGPAVLAAQLSFASDWNWASEQLLTELNWKPEASRNQNQSVLVVSSGPADEHATATLMFVHAINSAEKRIWIASPYFVPDEAVVTAIQLAALRGVDVRILIPDTPDHLTVYLCAFSFYKEATTTGAKIYRYTNGFLHQKTMLIDDRVSTIGTANLDNRSFRLNFEITAFVHDAAFATEVEQMFEDDFKNSRLMTDADVNDKSFWFKLAMRLARLSAPVQ